MESVEKKKVIIAGATGFVGRNLGKKLRENYHVIGLSRVVPKKQSDFADEWRSCDLLSLLDTERALEGVEFAYYLVHSMMPSARLSQGAFWDFDLIVADNFARAAKRAGVKQIIYLGGIVPERDVLSKHLQSRYEVEEALKNYGTPVTILRAGLVIGAEGSSFLTMTRTLERAPFLFCPPWADTLSHPIALKDAVAQLSFCLENKQTYDQTYDIGGPELMSYRTMMNEIARALGKSRPVLRVFISKTRVLQFFVSLLSGAPRELVQPLIDSLKYPIVARERKLNGLMGMTGTSFRQAAREAVEELRAQQKGAKHLPIAFQKPRTQGGLSTVRSVQRYRPPKGKTAEWVAREYLSWLPHALKWFLKVSVGENETFSICLRFFLKKPLLILQRSKERSWPDRWLFYIRGGVLAAESEKERLEFREVLGRRFVLVAIHEYRPTLPWYIYIVTQAKLHLWVMRSFQKYLETV